MIPAGPTHGDSACVVSDVSSSDALMRTTVGPLPGGPVFPVSPVTRVHRDICYLLLNILADTRYVIPYMVAKVGN